MWIDTEGDSSKGFRYDRKNNNERFKPINLVLRDFHFFLTKQLPIFVMCRAMEDEGTWSDFFLHNQRHVL